MAGMGGWGVDSEEIYSKVCYARLSMRLRARKIPNQLAKFRVMGLKEKKCFGEFFRISHLSFE